MKLIVWGQPARLLSRRLALAISLAASVTLAACGGWWDDDIPGVEITGVAATGAAIVNGEVKVVNAKGESASTRTGADGGYRVTIADAPPFVLSVVDGAGKTWYSYAAAAGTAHITPLTTLALLDANADKPLADLMAAWGTARPSEAQVLEGAKTVNANLRSVMVGAGVDPNSVNVFNAPGFAANRSGLDAVLDAMRVSFNCTANACTQTVSSPGGSLLVSWNGNIATTGITVSWDFRASDGTGGGVNAGGSGSLTVGLGNCKAPVAGTWSMVVQTTVSGLGGAAIPEICVDGLPGAPSSQTEFCASDTAKAQLPPGVSIVDCSFSGNTGSITARITTPVVLDYTIKYVFVKR